jgi:hypothetical protein
MRAEMMAMRNEVQADLAKTHDKIEQVHEGLTAALGEVKQVREGLKDVALEITEGTNLMWDQPPGTAAELFCLRVGEIDRTTAKFTTLTSVLNKVYGDTPPDEFSQLQDLCSHLRGAWYNNTKKQILFEFDCVACLAKMRASVDLQVQLIQKLGLRDSTAKREAYWVMVNANYTDNEALETENRDATIKQWSKELELNIQEVQLRMGKLYIRLPSITQALKACRNLLTFANGSRVAR